MLTGILFLIFDFIQTTSGVFLLHIAVFNVTNYYPNFPRCVERLASDQGRGENTTKVRFKGPLRGNPKPIVFVCAVDRNKFPLGNRYFSAAKYSGSVEPYNSR